MPWNIEYKIYDYHQTLINKSNFRIELLLSIWTEIK